MCQQLRASAINGNSESPQVKLARKDGFVLACLFMARRPIQMPPAISLGWSPGSRLVWKFTIIIQYVPPTLSI